MGIKAGLLWCNAAHKSVVYADYGITPGMAEGILRMTKLNKVVEVRTIL
jgi:hypothetical protein